MESAAGRGSSCSGGSYFQLLGAGRSELKALHIEAWFHVLPWEMPREKRERIPVMAED